MSDVGRAREVHASFMCVTCSSLGRLSGWSFSFVVCFSSRSLFVRPHCRVNEV